MLQRIEQLQPKKQLEGDFGGMFDIEAWKRETTIRMTPEIEHLVMDSVNELLETPIDATHPSVIALIGQRTEQMSRFNETTGADVKRLLEQAMIDGDDIDVMSEKLSGYFDDIAPWRAKLIARTEAYGAHNAATQVGIQEAGYPRKMWITSRDAKVRDSHQIDGQVVNINEDFILADGERMQFPQDFNERCVHIGTAEPRNVAEAALQKVGDEEISVSETNSSKIDQMYNLSPDWSPAPGIEGKLERLKTRGFDLTRDRISTDLDERMLNNVLNDLDKITYDLNNRFAGIERLNSFEELRIRNLGIYNSPRLPSEVLIRNGYTTTQAARGSIAGMYSPRGRGTILMSNPAGYYRFAEALNVNKRHWSSGPTPKSIFRHEYGHHYYHNALGDDDLDDFKKLFKKYGGTNKISGYGDVSDGEMFAEAFAQYTSPLYSQSTVKLPTDIENFLEKVLK